MKSVYIRKTGEREGKRERDRHTLRNVFLLFGFFSMAGGHMERCKVAEGDARC